MALKLLALLAGYLGLSGVSLIMAGVALWLEPPVTPAQAAVAVAKAVPDAVRTVRKVNRVRARLADDDQPEEARVQRRPLQASTPRSAHLPQTGMLPRSDAPAAVALTESESRVVVALNKYRAGYGLAPLAPQSQLMACARDRSRVMTNRNAHNPGGEWPTAAARRYGYRSSRPVNEDFAKPFYPEEAIWGWSQSYGHAMAMKGWMNINGRWVNCQYNEVGVGVHGDAIVAMFGVSQ